MAIYHCSIKPVARSKGRSAVAAAAYRAAVVLTNDRDGQTHDYSHRSGVVACEIVLPEGSDAAWALDRAVLWNAAEAAERRSDARTAREIVLALPHELTDDQRLTLARGFAEGLAQQYGVAVDIAVHRPHPNGNAMNHHAHLLMTTRSIGPSGLGEKSMLEWENKRLEQAGLPTTQAQVAMIRLEWEQQANEALARAGFDIKIDRRSHVDRGLEIDPTTHVGVQATSMARAGQPIERTRVELEMAARNAERVQANPGEVLSIITNEKSVFDHRDIARTLHRYIDAPDAYQAALAKVMASPALMKLQDARTGADGTVEPARYTTKAMFGIEHDMAVRAEAMAQAKGFGVRAERAIARFEAGKGFALKDEQRIAVLSVTGDEQIAVVSGMAGAGKSTMLGAANDAWVEGGRRVFGAALSGKAAEGLQESSGIQSRTLASWELKWKRGVDELRRGDVFVIDEAGMVSSEQLARFVAATHAAGAKLVLVGDAEQLQPINAGAAFRAVSERVGGVDLEAITRQREAWMRTASVDFGRNRTASGIAAYAERGAVELVENRAAVIFSMVFDAVRDMERRPEGSRIVLAHRRDDVRELNDRIRAVRRANGALTGEVVFQTHQGERHFAPGDRLVFLKNDSKLGVKNGMLGTVEKAEDGRLVVRPDGKRGSVTVAAGQYSEVDHGYATTIHKSQGATVDRAFVMASGSMDRHLTYVGMTRHREAVTLYAGQDEFRDVAVLSERLGRSNAKETTLDYTERRGLVPSSEIVVPEAMRPELVATPPSRDRAADSLREKVQAARERQEAAKAATTVKTPREALRQELRGLDDRRLSEATVAGMVPIRRSAVDFDSRPMTDAEGARLVSPAYVVAADHAARLGQEAAEVAKSIEHYEGVADHNRQEVESIRKARGAVSRFLFKPDHAENQAAEAVKSATARLGHLEKRRNELMKELPAAEQAAAEALEQARPRAEAKLAELQERAEIAREVQAERWQAEMEQSRQRREAEAQEAARKVEDTRLARVPEPVLTSEQRETNDGIIASLRDAWFAETDDRLEAGLQAMVEKARQLSAGGRALDDEECQKELAKLGRAAQREWEREQDRGMER